jgi:hypothetical protein
MAACECGDIAGEPYEQPQSVDRLVARLPALYRRLVNYGYLLDASLLRAMVEKLKRNDRYCSRDHDVLQIASAMAIRKARGEDPARVWDELDD